ncbi:MAG TPA: PEP-CTERM sorting domain-containing protein, partial [Verrucomicrobiae bacterium]
SPFVNSYGLANPSGSSGNTLLSQGGVYYYELLTSIGLNYVPSNLSQFGTNLNNSWVDTGLTLTNSSTGNGRAAAINPNTAAIANNWASGSTQNIILVGWSANLGTTWSAALAHLNDWGNFSSALYWNNPQETLYFGVGTGVGTLTIGGVNPGIGIFGSGAGQLNYTDTGTGNLVMYELLTVPEPTTIALVGLGGIALLALRRKR